MRCHAAAVLIALAASTTLISLRVSPVSAECPYLPAWPPITPAIPSAREIVVGEVVEVLDQADLLLGADQGARAYALRITHVLRGDRKPGELLDIQYLRANWPQTRSASFDGYLASCSSPRAAPGEVIALAFDARHPGGPMRDDDYEWIQPPTRYNAIGVIKGPGGSQGTNQLRERVTLRQLRALAALPPTDSAALVRAVAVPRSSDAMRLLLMLACLLGLGFGLRRFHVMNPSPAWGRRVAPDGVRRSER